MKPGKIYLIIFKWPTDVGSPDVRSMYAWLPTITKWPLLPTSSTEDPAISATSLLPGPGSSTVQIVTYPPDTQAASSTATPITG